MMGVFIFSTLPTSYGRISLERRIWTLPSSAPPRYLRIDRIVVIVHRHICVRLAENKTSKVDEGYTVVPISESLDRADSSGISLQLH
jgi:hypothetical protein